MKIFRAAMLGAAIFVAACAPKPVQIVHPVPASIRNASMISDVEVTLSPIAQRIMDKFEEKASEKRASAGLPPVDPSVEPAAGTPQEQYDTLPFAQMFELVVKEVARDKGLDHGRALRVKVEIDTLKTANAGMTILAGSSDQLAGQVQIFDAGNGEALGEFYVDVINAHSGLLGLALRGGGVREKLANEFAGHIVKQLTTKGKK
jgi:hypothetical protein